MDHPSHPAPLGMTSAFRADGVADSWVFPVSSAASHTVNLMLGMQSTSGATLHGHGDLTVVPVRLG